MESYLINVGLSFFGYFVYVAVFYLIFTAITVVSTIALKHMIKQGKVDIDVFEGLIEKARITQEVILPGVSVLLLLICLVFSLSFTANRPKLKPHYPDKAATYFNQDINQAKPKPQLEIKDITLKTESKAERDTRFKAITRYDKTEK